MEIVVDTNVIISSLLKDGLTRRIILLSPFDMYTLSYAEEEIESNREELTRKSKLDDDSFKYTIRVLLSKINLIPLESIEPFRDRAIEIMREIDVNDAPFLALAIMLNSPIWSNDDHFKRQNAARVFTTREILPLFGI
jgi:predicted nucleic acid-binding protein